jgi:hypothetical protein
VVYIAELTIALLILMFAGYFVITKVVQPKLKEKRRDTSLIGSLHEKRKEAESRIERADEELDGLNWSDPNFTRWWELRSRAVQDKRGIDAAIEEYHIQQEEERMLNGG